MLTAENVSTGPARSSPPMSVGAGRVSRVSGKACGAVTPTDRRRVPLSQSSVHAVTDSAPDARAARRHPFAPGPAAAAVRQGGVGADAAAPRLAIDLYARGAGPAPSWLACHVPRAPERYCSRDTRAGAGAGAGAVTHVTGRRFTRRPRCTLSAVRSLSSPPRSPRFDLIP